MPKLARFFRDFAHSRRGLLEERCQSLFFIFKLLIAKCAQTGIELDRLVVVFNEEDFKSFVKMVLLMHILRSLGMFRAQLAAFRGLSFVVPSFREFDDCQSLVTQELVAEFNQAWSLEFYLGLSPQAKRTFRDIFCFSKTQKMISFVSIQKGFVQSVFSAKKRDVDARLKCFLVLKSKYFSLRIYSRFLIVLNIKNDLEKFMNNIYEVSKNKASPFILFLNAAKRSKDFCKYKKILQNISEQNCYNHNDPQINLGAESCHDFDPRSK